MTEGKPFQDWVDESVFPPMDKKIIRLFKPEEAPLLEQFEKEGPQRREKLVELLNKKQKQKSAMPDPPAEE